jgi:class 3 adenylate cyclase
MSSSDYVTPPFLEYALEDGAIRRVPVTDRLFIGRQCEGVADDKRIVIPHASVSRDHAVVSRTRRGLTIRDTSKNGTRVNGVRGTTGAEQPLGDGDQIEIGPLTLRAVTGGLPRASDTEAIDTRTETISLDRHVTHLVADVRDYSTVAQEVGSAVVCSVMAEVFHELSRITHRHHGTVKDYAGDAIFAYWEHGPAETRERAVDACRAALEQAQAARRLAASLPDECAALRSLRIGWGLSTGRVTLSHYGVRNDNVAVVGDATNLAFRLSALALRTLQSPIVLCEETARLVAEKMPLRAHGRVETKGRKGRELVFGLDLTQAT